MAALAGLDFEFNLLGLAIADDPKRLTRFDGVQNGNQSLGDSILGSDLSHQILLADLAGGNKKKRPTALASKRLGRFLNCGRGPLHQLAKIFNQDVANTQISFHDSRTVQLSERPPKPKSIKTRKYSDDCRGVFLYKTIGSAIRDRRLSFHQPQSYPNRLALPLPPSTSNQILVAALPRCVSA